MTKTTGMKRKDIRIVASFEIHFSLIHNNMDTLVLVNLVSSNTKYGG